MRSRSQADSQAEHDYRYIIGIDLGTTNSAVSFLDLACEEADSGPGARPQITPFPIPQLVAAGELAYRPVLPSFLYLPGPHDLPPGSLQLPWEEERDYAAGEFARTQGVMVPGRMVSSAKSWLCHAGVDRTADILPWNSQTDTTKYSPAEVSTRYLLHIRQAWNHEVALGKKAGRFEEQLLVVTVPASFDEVARELTVVAAKAAGLKRIFLLEEPLAAFYSWLAANEAEWQSQLSDGQIILVCDVGGGTTDFTIIAVKEGKSGPGLNRLAVGDHLMLGGDNMDLTLGRYMEAALSGKAGSLDAQRWHQLCCQCRQAKEDFFENGSADCSFEVAVAGRGSDLIASTLRGRLQGADLQQLIVDGFFPSVTLAEGPGESQRKGLTDLGLPYVQNPAITRHLAAFWRTHAPFVQQETGRANPYPDFVLFNGGALKPAVLRKRMLKTIAGWFRSTSAADWQPQELLNPRPDLAVSIGASYYGLVRLGSGVRVGSGSPRAYYAAVASGVSSGPPATKPAAICIVPRGTEEGALVTLTKHSFAAVVNQPAVFQMYSSSTRLGDRPGDLVQPDAIDTVPLPPISTILRQKKSKGSTQIPVTLAAQLNEVGTLGLWCQARSSSHRWQLHFDVRHEFKSGEATDTGGDTLDTEVIDRAKARIRATFQSGAARVPPEKLNKDLIAILDQRREDWPKSAIRPLAETLLQLRKGRTFSSQHEARWLNLLGFCLRPGFGDPADEWHLKEAWKLYAQGPASPKSPDARSEWWICWRRIAGGLSAGKQQQIFQQIYPYLRSPEKLAGRKAYANFPKKLSAHERIEIWMALANLERLPVAHKTEMGQCLLREINRRRPNPRELWAVGRLGTRRPFYGPLNLVLPAAEAAVWVEQLLDLELKPGEQTAFTLVQLAGLCGDRSRDLPAETRQKVAAWLAGLSEGDRFTEMLENQNPELEFQEKIWQFGESLPAGLVLTQES